MNEEGRERLTRLEERLTAERSVRKTRDDQIFKRFESFGSGLEEVSENQSQMTLKLQSVEQTLEQDIEDRKEITKLVMANTATLQQINGSIKTMKWLWPIILLLVGSLTTYFMKTVDLQTAAATQKVESKTNDQEPALPVQGPQREK